MLLLDYGLTKREKREEKRREEKGSSTAEEVKDEAFYHPAKKAQNTN